MSENKINTGAIFKNTKKTAQMHPDYRGEEWTAKRRAGPRSWERAG